MNSDKLFTRAVAALPKTIRMRLDADSPLDWAALQDPATGAKLGEAARTNDRLPDCIEKLASRLIADVGIAPTDLATGVEGYAAAAAWEQAVTVEAEGESYRIRNDANGELHTGIRPEAIAGYVILALELAAAVQKAGERWIEAGERHKGAAEDTSSLLVLCAIQMYEHLRSFHSAAPMHRTTSALASTLDHAWNTQSHKTRAALSCIRIRVSRGASAPRRRHYAPMTGYRLHSFHLGEIRWLAALAEQAATAVGKEEQQEQQPSNSETRATTVEHGVTSINAATTDICALEARIRAANQEAGTLQLGSHPDVLVAGRELSELMCAARRLSDPVRRRMRASYGIRFTQALSRLRDTAEADSVSTELEAAMSKHRVPRWLEELATTLLMDTGVQTHEGTRTARIRLHSELAPETGYRVIEDGTGAIGQLTPVGLIEQIRLSLVFALEAWRGHSALRSAGKESTWILDKGGAEGSEFSDDERETLNAARRIEVLLDLIQRSNGKQTPTALEEASMSAHAFKEIGPPALSAVGWPASAEAPNPRNPEEVHCIATVAEALHEEIRSIANKFIASWIASDEPYSQARNDRTAQELRDETPSNVGIADDRKDGGGDRAPRSSGIDRERRQS